MLDESGAAIEPTRAGVRDDQQASAAGLTGTLGGVLEEGAADAMPHRLRFDE